jgi:hypothetical protein
MIKAEGRRLKAESETSQKKQIALFLLSDSAFSLRPSAFKKLTETHLRATLE